MRRTARLYLSLVQVGLHTRRRDFCLDGGNLTVRLDSLATTHLEIVLAALRHAPDNVDKVIHATVVPDISCRPEGNSPATSGTANHDFDAEVVTCFKHWSKVSLVTLPTANVLAVRSYTAGPTIRASCIDDDGMSSVVE